MGEFLKTAATLLAGRMNGSTNKATFIVKTLRTVYVVDATLIGVIWYSAWRNERVKPGEMSFPFPGWKKLKRKFPPDRPEKELEDEGAFTPRHREWGNSLSEAKSKAGKTKAGITHTGNLLGIPQTPEEARAMQGVSTFDNHPVSNWIIPYLIYARAQGWSGHVESGYRTPAEQIAAAKSYGLWHYPSGPLASNHVKKNFPGGAVDVTQAAQLNGILQQLPGGSLLQWAGASDPVHFSYHHNGGY